jgi:diguanylate cyclase (GGDEF)-like protein
LFPKDLMSPAQFAQLIQAAGTLLLFLLFLLLYRKIRRRAFLDWIASWAFLFIGLFLQLVARPDAGPIISLLTNGALLAHVIFLIRGTRRFRNPADRTTALDLLWILPAAAIAWWAATAEPGHAPTAPMALVRSAAYVLTAIWFALTPGSAAGRIFLSISFLLWGAERAVSGLGLLKFGSMAELPAWLQYFGFAGMFLEMMIAVGIIVLLFEATQARLAAEMEALQHSERELKEMGVRDPLTGLYNRHHFNDVIRRELANVRRYGTELSVLVVDVDRFKQINDAKGHAVGDEVLRFVANYLTTCIRESDFVFRWGGDEFLLLLPRTDEGSAAQKGDELVRKLPKIPGTEGLQPSLSAGWATHRMDAEFPATLALADQRMYEMKIRGKRERAERERDLGLL